MVRDVEAGNPCLWQQQLNLVEQVALAATNIKDRRLVREFVALDQRLGNRFPAPWEVVVAAVAVAAVTVPVVRLVLLGNEHRLDLVVDHAGEVVALRRLMVDSLGVTIAPRSAGTLAHDVLAAKGRSSDYDDLRAEALSSAPPEIDGLREDGTKASADRPELPWTAAEPQDFLGNLFLFWLWWQCDRNEGMVETSEGEVSLVIDKVLDLECAWGLSGRTSLRGDMPTRRAETARAVQSGKWPRKIGLTLSQFDRVWECTLQGDRFEVSGLKLPKPEDKPQSWRLVVEERLDSFATFDAALMSLYRAFVEERCSRSWPTRRAELRAWISELGATRTMIAVGV